MRQIGLVGTALACLFAFAPAYAAAPDYDALVKSFYDEELRAHPADATAEGLHDYDAKLDDISPAAHARETKRLKAALAAFQAIDPASLDPSRRDDREVLIGQIKGDLLNLERIQTWRTNPNRYVELATGSVFSLVQRDFAPLADRMRSAIARERQIPAMLATARKFLSDTPKPFVDTAILNAGGAIDFFKNGAPAAFASVTDPALQREFKASNEGVLKALESYRQYLKADLLPKANGNFALGAEALAEHLKDFDMIDVPLDQLRALAWSHLWADQAAFAETAKQVDPGGTLDSAIVKLQSDHPKADGLVTEASKELADLKQFIKDKNILTIPPELDLHVAETPPFARALVSAEFDPPGPFEHEAREAFYYVTPPDMSEPPAKIEEYLGAFDYSDFIITSAHEVWPGHYVQFLVNKSHPDWSLVRQLSGTQSSTEGWAHYTEEMIVEQGYGGPTPMLKLGQIEEALLRDCRMVASFELHTQGMSVEAAAELFNKQCYVPAPVALSEARRGTSDPGYLTYTLGKLAILKLREDYRQKMGDKFTLADFHDRFLAAGLLPIPIIRRELMGADGKLL